MFDIVIIGSGPAGLSAGIYAARANKKVGIIEGREPCGQLMKTTHIENFPGFAKPILGQDLMENIYEQTKNLGVEFIKDIAMNIEKIDNIFKITLKTREITALSIIICTGSSPRLLGLEKNLLGYGISTCATCDGNFYKNQIVAVIGGGNSAFEEAIYLSNIAKKVYLIHRKTTYNCEAIMLQRALKAPNIEFLNPYITKKFIGEKKLEAITIKNLETNEAKTININAAFIAIGQIPNTKFIKNLITLTPSGHIKGTITNIPGIFAAGDVMDSKYKQAITSAGFGCIAALESLKYLEFTN